MNAQRCGQDMTERRKSQNFQSLPHYLTESVWHSLECDSREKAAMSLWQHAWKLGMRCPSEMTFSVVYNLLVLTKSEKKDLSMFEQRTFLQHLKKEWKKFKGLKKAEDFQYADYVEILPMEVKDLPAEYYLVAFAEQEAVPCRLLHLCMAFFSTCLFPGIWWKELLFFLGGLGFPL